MRCALATIVLIVVPLITRCLLAETYTFKEVVEPGTYEGVAGGAVNNLGDVVVLARKGRPGTGDIGFLPSQATIQHLSV